MNNKKIILAALCRYIDEQTNAIGMYREREHAARQNARSLRQKVEQLEIDLAAARAALDTCYKVASNAPSQ